MSELKIIEYKYKPTDKNNNTKQKKRPNPYLLYMKERVKQKEDKLKITDFHKIISKEWRAMPEEKKDIYRKRYEMNRDLPP